jgi:hypothetical protein
MVNNGSVNFTGKTSKSNTLNCNKLSIERLGDTALIEMNATNPVILMNGGNCQLSLKATDVGDCVLELQNLPTVAPSAGSNRVWNDAGILKIQT